MTESDFSRAAVGNLEVGFARTNRRIARKRSGTGGAAAIEFALVMPVLLSLAMGILEFAWLYYVENQMAYVVRAVARDVSAGVYPSTEAKGKVTARLAEHFPYTFDEPSADVDPTDNDITVSVSIPMADAALVNFLNLFGSGTLNASVTMKITSS